MKAGRPTVLVPITEVAAIIRSKNAGPYVLTLDIIFTSQVDYLFLKSQQFFTRELIAGLYQVELDDVFKIVYFDPASAVKANLRRPIVSGGPGDTDVYGAQQHAPLLKLMVPVER